MYDHSEDIGLSYFFSADRAIAAGASISINGKYSLSIQKNTECSRGGFVVECGGRISDRTRYLTARVTSDEERCAKLFVLFYSGDPDAELLRPEITYSINLMPHTVADAIFDLRHLDATVRYPMLQPGTLKSHLNGHAVKPENVRYMAVLFAGQKALQIDDMRLTAIKPKKLTAEHKTVDSLGQWNVKSWPGKVSDAQSLEKQLKAESDQYKNTEFPSGWSRIGSDSTKKLTEGCGFFRVCRDDKDKWWLVDPDGYAFYSNGCFGIYPGEPGWIYGNEDRFERLERDSEYGDAWSYAKDSELFRRKFDGMFPKKTELYSFGTANLITAFKKDWKAEWLSMTEGRCRAWGINTISMFSDREFIQKSGLPYVIMLKKFPQTSRSIWRGFPDVFSDEYKTLCGVFAEQIAECRNDPMLIGYFLNNEPLWAWEDPAVITENLMLGGIGTASHTKMIEFWKQKYGESIEKLNDIWNTDFKSFEAFEGPVADAMRFGEGAVADMKEFAMVMIHEYASVAASAVRRADPNHLNLGMRFAAYNKAFADATLDCFDVFSFNCYGRRPLEKLPPNDFSKPFMITEFHFGAYDRGLPAASLIPVETQKDRAELYISYMNSVLSHPNCVGTQWFAWNDQPLWGRYDGENYQFGFVDICNLPYREFIEAVRSINNNVYSIK